MMYGGICFNIVCVFIKWFIYEVEKVSWFYFIDYEKQVEVYKVVIVCKNEMIVVLRGNMFNKLSSFFNVIIYIGMVLFVLKDVVKVIFFDEVIEFQGKKIFINIGFISIILVIDGLKDSKWVYISILLMELDVLLCYLIIVGGGYIGLEFVLMYVSFGSKVIVFEGGNKFIVCEDCDIVDVVKEIFEKKGIEICFNVCV